MKKLRVYHQECVGRYLRKLSVYQQERVGSYLRKLRAEHQVPVPVKRTSKECRIKCEPDLKEKVKSIASSACARGHERQ